MTYYIETGELDVTLEEAKVIAKSLKRLLHCDIIIKDEDGLVV